MHLSDVHLDLDYVEGANKYCDYLICCRKVNGQAEVPSKRAGKLGSYKCDTPLSLLIAMGDFVNAEIQPHSILWTGDTVPHNMNEEREASEKFRYLQRTAQYLEANLSTATVYPAMGNHDYMVSNL